MMQKKLRNQIMLFLLFLWHPDTIIISLFKSKQLLQCLEGLWAPATMCTFATSETVPPYHVLEQPVMPDLRRVFPEMQCGQMEDGLVA